MDTFYEKVKERMIRYAKINSQSMAKSPTAPSTMIQFTIADHLVDELKSIGVENVSLSKECVIFGTIPSNLPNDRKCLSLGLVAHMDTTPDVTGTDVKPWIYENYPGGDVVLNKEKHIVMEESAYPNLKQFIGQDIIFSDGTTLLGADDKAGLAEIMTMAEYLIAHPEISHGPIQIGITPDEEVGRGAENFDVEKFGADIAYTVDGDTTGIYGYETFNAAEADLTIHGLNVHPGYAKDIMLNAIEIGGEFMEMLPAFERPQYTKEREGYFHPFTFNGTVEKCEIRCLIRDHDLDHYYQRKAYVEKCVDMLNHKYGDNTVELSYDNIYFSMLREVEKVPFMIDYLVEAIESEGIEAKAVAFRGGTDGSVLSQKGLPCPNINSGFQNGHSRFEFVPIQQMVINTKILLKLVSIYAEHAE